MTKNEKRTKVLYCNKMLSKIACTYSTVLL